MGEGHFGQPEVGKEESARERLPRQYHYAALEDLTVLEAGDQVRFANSSELVKFEAALISAKLPEARLDRQFQTRRLLSREVKPNDSLASLRNISASILDEPYNILIELYPSRRQKDTATAKNTTIGFRVSADLYTTGVGIKPTEALVWIITRDKDAKTRKSQLDRKIHLVPKTKII